MFKKQRVREFRNDTSQLDEVALKNEYEALDKDDKFTYQVIAVPSFFVRPISMTRLSSCQKTNGTITWGDIAYQLRDIIDKGTARTHIQNLDGFKVRKNRILPFLDISAKDRRVVWGRYSGSPGNQFVL